MHDTLRVGDELRQDSESDVFVPAHRRRVGYVFQDTGLLTHLNVRGNPEYGMKRRGHARSELVFARTTERVGIGPPLERRIQGLSSAERSRAAIASA